MNRKPIIVFGFSAILIFYAFLYVATKKEYCDDLCQKIQEINIQMRQSRSFITGAYQCGDSILCVAIRDTIPYSWNNLADTACIYLETQSLFDYRVVIIKDNYIDTLGQQQCP